MKYTRRVIPVLVSILILTSCGSETSSGGAGQTAGGYKDTKSMVMDILKSDDGKKAIQSAAFGTGDEEKGGGGGGSGGTGIKTLAVGDAKQLQLAVKDVLTDSQNSAFLQTLMKDPKFSGDFAKAIAKENKQLHKDLMKDPDYQKQMLDLMKNPEYEKMLIDTMRGNQYRQHMMTVIQESMQSPLFKAEMIQMLKKALEEGTAAQAKTADKGGGKGGTQGGDDDKDSDKGKDDSQDSDQNDSQKKKDKKSDSSS
jgi:spore germination protein D